MRFWLRSLLLCRSSRKILATGDERRDRVIWRVHLMNDPTPPLVTNLPERLALIRADMKEEYLQEHQTPWIVGFSGGKDSTIVLQLVFEMLLELPPSKEAPACSRVVE